MRYVGSFYVPEASTENIALEVEKLIYDIHCPRDGFQIQAMLLLAIGLDGFTHQEKALRVLNEAIDLALALGMNTRDFASTQGQRLPAMAESWRRTWWELYVVDGMIAGVHQRSSFRLNEVALDVQLPCEERDYMSGVSVTCIVNTSPINDIYRTFRHLTP